MRPARAREPSGLHGRRASRAAMRTGSCGARDRRGGHARRRSRAPSPAPRRRRCRCRRRARRARRRASRISAMLYGLRMPMPLPIGEPSGITAAQPTSARRRASTGSSVVYGSTTKPSSTSSSAARSSSGASGSSVSSSPITSSLTQSVANASRASCAVSTASRAVWQPAVFGSSSTPASASTSISEPRGAAGSTRRSATVTSSLPLAAIASASSSSEGKPPVPSSRRERSVRPAIVSASASGRRVGSRRCRRALRRAGRSSRALSHHPPCIAVSTSTRASLGAARTTPSCARGTTSPSTATATPRASSAQVRAARAPRRRSRPARRSDCSPLSTITRSTACGAGAPGRATRTSAAKRRGSHAPSSASSRLLAGEQPRDQLARSAARAGCRCGGGRSPTQARRARRGRSRARCRGCPGAGPTHSSSISQLARCRARARAPRAAARRRRRRSGCSVEAALLDGRAEHVAAVGARHEVAALEAHDAAQQARAGGIAQAQDLALDRAHGHAARRPAAPRAAPLQAPGGEHDAAPALDALAVRRSDARR